MKRVILESIASILLAILCLFIGSRAGYNLASKKINNEYLHEHKRELLSEVNAKMLLLKCLRDNNTDKAISALEDFVDVDLNSLATYERNGELNSEVKKIIIYIRNYREKYGDHKVNEKFQKSILGLMDKYKSN